MNFKALKALTFIFYISSCSDSPLDASSNCDIGSGVGIRGVPYKGNDLAEKQLSFMFVGGPTGVTPSIARYLGKDGLGAVSTFFVTGNLAYDTPNLVADVYNNGHLIGNMGYSGGNILDSLDPRISIRSTEINIIDYIKGNMFLLYMTDYRFTYVTNNYLNQGGLEKYVGPIKPDIGDVDDRSTDFRTDSECWAEGISESDCAENYFQEIERLGKGLVIFSDTDERTYTLLQELVPVLYSSGYSIVPIYDIPQIYDALNLAGADITATNAEGTCNDFK